jgi:hypothetical protein
MSGLPEASPLDDRGLLDALDAAAGSTPLDAGLLLVGTDGGPMAELDRRLLALRAARLGPLVHAVAECPACGAELELTLDARELAPTEDGDELSLRCDGWELAFRMPSAADVAAVASLPDVAAARGALIERCVLGASLGGEAVTPAELPEPVVTAMAERMAARDPLGGSRIALECPECGEMAEQTVDVPWLVRRELAAEAARLTEDVHLLASAYGWSEAEILSLTPARRARYLARVEG